MRQFPSISTLREKHKKFEQENSGGQSSIFYPYYELKIGASSRIRFLPNKVDDDSLIFGFLKQKFNHKFEVNGEPKSVPCLNMYGGESCPICEVSSKFYKAEGKTSVRGKLYWRKKSHLALVLILEDGIEHAEGETDYVGQVRPINLGFQLFNIVQDSIMEGELDEPPYAYEGGTDFVMKKTQQGQYATYSIGSKFVRKPTDLDSETLEEIESQLIDLSSLIPAKPDYEYLKKLVNASMAGTSIDLDEDEDEEEEDEEETTVTIRPRSTKTGSKTSTVKAKEEDLDDDDDDILDAEEKILADIRARRKAG